VESQRKGFADAKTRARGSPKAAPRRLPNLNQGNGCFRLLGRKVERLDRGQARGSYEVTLLNRVWRKAAHRTV
jgi:hypothetical protein